MLGINLTISIGFFLFEVHSTIWGVCCAITTKRLNIHEMHGLSPFPQYFSCSSKSFFPITWKRYCNKRPSQRVLNHREAKSEATLFFPEMQVLRHPSLFTKGRTKYFKSTSDAKESPVQNSLFSVSFLTSSSTQCCELKDVRVR